MTSWFRLFFFASAFLCSWILLFSYNQYPTGRIVQTFETTLVEFKNAKTTPAKEQRESKSTQLEEWRTQQQQPLARGLMSNSSSSSSLIIMETKEIAPGVEMPVISIGTGGLERSKAYDIVSNWLSLGGTGIDTALNYNNQDKVADAIDYYNNTIMDGTLSRKDLFVTTKIPDCNVNDVAKHIDENLQQLRTSYIDLLLIHTPRIGNCLRAWKVLEDYYRQNKTRAIGVSNFRQENLKPLVERSKVIPHVNQIKVNIAHRDMDTIRYSSQHGIVIEGYSPLGRGGGEVVNLPIVRTIATSHNVTPYQVAVKWILQHGWITTFQSSSKEHQASNADVFGWQLSSEEMDQLDQVGGELKLG